MTIERKAPQVYAIEHETVQSPSNLIKKELGKLPSGTVVGLATPKELHEPNFGLTEDGMDYDLMWTLTPGFWKELVDFCRNKSFKVVFLTTLDVETRLAALRSQYTSINADRIKFYYGRSKSEDVEGVPEGLRYRLKERQLKEDMYAAEVAMEYQGSVERGRMIAELIAENRVEVAVMSIQNADFSLSGGFDSSRSTPWVEYVKQEFNPNNNPRHFLKSRQTKTNTSWQEDYLRRIYRIVTEWRVTDADNIDGIGTWDLDNRYDGLFELTLYSTEKNGRFTGRVEDRLGSALVNGRMVRDLFEMEKRYDKTIFPGAISTPIKYQGVATVIGSQPAYQGIWTSREKNGHFVFVNYRRFPQDSF